MCIAMKGSTEMTPLQKAAQALLNSWDSPRLFTDSEFEELRKALDAEIAQSVEPEGYVLVPIEATQSMIDAYRKSPCSDLYGLWHEIITAAQGEKP